MSVNRLFDIICFDCDSTLSRIEGIDELARSSGNVKEVAHLTQIAMDGGLALEAVYEKRLQLIRPNQNAIASLAELYIKEIVDGAVEVFSILKRQGKQVHIISGGIRQAILPLAKYLGLPPDHVHAVDVYFDDSGNYLGYDTASPLSRSGGKAEICRQLNGGGRALVMIGDGQTDLESKQAGAYFIGFGGIVAREAVRKRADVYVGNNSLQSIVQYIN